MRFYLHCLTHDDVRYSKVSTDRDYDTRTCHHVLKNKRITPCIPPRSNTGYWEKGHPRNETVKALKKDKLSEWKRTGVITNAY
ncbi:transposase [Candidatus Enterovibrio escicola]|uniref:Mobile element protein n=1 Tax=Candidatus Enterovibrio escicola TaxID=1927127 RepID=A0A2A5T049_9GAMM|nr:Mobile element protein [Candidatus Enterovibrio escacola]